MNLGWLLPIALFAAPQEMAAPVEQAWLVRAAALLSMPFSDAAPIAPVAAGESVTVISRSGGWVQVRANGRTGWLRALDLRFAATGKVIGNPDLARLADELRTGSKRKTPVVGIKGRPFPKIDGWFTNKDGF